MNILNIISNKPSTKLAIIMPLFNEGGIISKVVEDWIPAAKTHHGNLIIINDGSTDQSFKYLEDLAKKHSELIIIDKQNSGHASTCLLGYKWAIENGYEWIFQTDSDGQTDPADFKKLWEQKPQNDFLWGHRVKRGDGLFRYLISKTLSITIMIIFQVYIKDSNVPFRLMRSSKLKEVLDLVPEKLFLGNAYLSILITKNFGIKWVPISFGTREVGSSSINFLSFFKIGFKSLINFIKLR